MADDAVLGLGFEVADDMKDLNNSVAYAVLDDLYEVSGDATED